MRCITVTNETEMSASLLLNIDSVCLHCPVYSIQQEDCSTPEVLGWRSCGHRSLVWCMEQSIGQSERIEDAG